jgi:hypothetical protein
MTSLPKFDNYEEEGPTDYGYEALQDFFLSWTLRCSPHKYRCNNPKLQEYARRIVYVLIYGNNDLDSYGLDGNVTDEFKVKEVQTKRQLGEIDLIVEIEAIVSGVEKKFLLNIENKWYSGLQSGQLEKYNKFVLTHFQKNEIINLFITCDASRKNYENEKNLCHMNNYKYLTIPHLKSLSKMDTSGETGNDLFDEYWFS